LTVRLVIVHDQAADLGGQERLAQALLEHFPDAIAVAPHFAATNRPAGHSAPWDGRTLLVGSGRARRRSFLAPLYARRLSRARIPEGEVMLSITHGGWSIAARVPPSTPHICYSSGLPPHLYGHVRSYLDDQPLLARPALAAAVPALRAYDRRLMRRPGRLITNSEFSARELQRIHGRSADVIYPPVRTHFFTPNAATERRAFLMVARLVTFKRVDMVVEAFRSLDEQLIVAGDGPALPRLRRVAPPNVTFAGSCDDDALLGYYRSSRALICPSVETFGIAMAEAQACGVPVIAARAGAALEVVKDRVTGFVLDRPDPHSIAESVRAVDSAAFQPRACRESAGRFSEARFISEIDAIFREELAAAHRAERPSVCAAEPIPEPVER
jgi:glycosyltransferase involved in cell wall biosynthesis